LLRKSIKDYRFSLGRTLGVPPRLDIIGSWVAVEPNGTGLPPWLEPTELGALLPSPKSLIH